MINIDKSTIEVPEGLSPELIFHALFGYAQMNTPLPTCPKSYDESEYLYESTEGFIFRGLERKRFDYVEGIAIKLELGGDTIWAKNYDKQYGKGSVEQVLSELSAKRHGFIDKFDRFMDMLLEEAEYQSDSEVSTISLVMEYYAFHQSLPNSDLGTIEYNNACERTKNFEPSKQLLKSAREIKAIVWGYKELELFQNEWFRKRLSEYSTLDAYEVPPTKLWYEQKLNN